MNEATDLNFSTGSLKTIVRFIPAAEIDEADCGR